MKLEKGLIIVLLVLIIIVNGVNISTFFFFHPTLPEILTGRATSSQNVAVSFCNNPPPTITAINNQNAVAGTLFTYQVVATDGADNTSLAYYDNTSLFAINQSGYISFTPTVGDVGTYSIRVTIQTNASCAPRNGSVDFSLAVAAAGGGGGAEGGGGGGGGGGGAAARGAPTEEVDLKKLEALLKLSDEIIKVSVKRYHSLEKQVTLLNGLDDSISVTLYNPLHSILGFSSSSFEVAGGAEYPLTLYFNSQRNALPGIYSGVVEFKIVDQSGNVFFKYLIVVVEVESEQVAFDASLDIFDKTLMAGENLTAAVTIVNLANISRADVTLFYMISNMSGATFYNESGALSLDQQVSFTKTIPLPPTMVANQYLLSLLVIYKDSFATATELFAVEEPLEQDLVGKAFGFRGQSTLLWIIILILLFIIMLYLRSRKSRNAAKKTPSPRKVVLPASRYSGRSMQDIMRLQRKQELLREWQRKQERLHESHSQGYISEETYKRMHTRIEDIIRRIQSK